MNKSTKFLIIGQGLAGSVLAMELERRGQDYLVMDGYSEPSSSSVAAGLVNPITGRKFVKSWRVDDLLPKAKETYEWISNILGVHFYEEIEIKRYLSSQKEINDWTILQTDPQYRKYVGEIIKEVNEYIKAPYGYGVIKKGAWLHCNNFIDAVKSFLKQEGKLLTYNFEHDNLDLKTSVYDDVSFDHIIFCEGYRKIFNPLFSFIPESYAKGEVLIIESDNLKSNSVLNKNFIVIPLGNDLYKVGATFARKDCDFIKTEEGRTKLVNKIDDLIKADYKIVDHLAGIRPTSKDRRPILGRHPIHNNVLIFNGLGTKGVSLAPLCATLLYEHLIDHTKIDPELSVERFF